MKCDKCGGRSLVVDSRDLKEGLRRRRECRDCRWRWSTIEVETTDYVIEMKIRQTGRQEAVAKAEELMRAQG